MSAAPYERLVKLIEHELQLAGEGRFDELADAAEVRGEYVKTLPRKPPEAARDALRRAAQLQMRLEVEVERGREAVLHAISEVEHVRRAARGYAPHRARIPQISASA